MTVETQGFVIQCEQELAEVSIVPVSREEGLTVYKASFAFAPGTMGGRIRVHIDYPMVGILSDFFEQFCRPSAIRQWYSAPKVRSEFYYGAPFVAAVQDGTDNHITVALSDAVNASQMRLSVEDFEQQEKIRFAVILLNGRERLNRYEVFIRIDERMQPMVKTVSELGEWFRGFYPERGACPPESEDALYSSWYNFHQHPDEKTLDAEMEIAAKMGFKTLIIDDGWQYDGPGTGDYIDCGDWSVSRQKFPDLRGFVRRTHEKGIKVMLWFPVPFAGYHTQDYQTFRDRMLYTSDSFGAGIFDVRYREVREHIVNLFVRFMKEYDLDGLKLDFIDSFRIEDETPPANERMDRPALSDAVIALLDELDEALRAIRPNVLLEYRQNYVGPAIARYGNMLRVGDCPFDLSTNRRGVADLRMLDYRLAIHSDMLYWAKEETADHVARQLLNVLFAVPQISVLLTEVPEMHVRIIKAFLDYWTANRKTLLHGEFTVEGIDCGYPLLSAKDEDKAITAVYENSVCHYEGGRHDFLNATAKTEIVVVSRTPSARAGRIVDMLGQTVAETILQPGANVFETPVGGRLEIEG